MYGWTNPNYYYMMNPYELSYLDYQGMSPYSNIWMPRNLYGLRKLVSFDPMMFFTNPFLSSINPLMSPALFNIHYPGMSTYGLCVWTSTYPSWIFTNNGTGGGLQHTLSNSHFYFDSESSAPVVRGPRSGRGTLRGIDSNSDVSKIYLDATNKFEKLFNSKVTLKENDKGKVTLSTSFKSINELYSILKKISN